MTTQTSTRAEVCAVACAELFRNAGEIMVSPMTTMVSVGARLARLTFSPDILLTDGEAQLLADTPPLGGIGAFEGWMPFGRVFETLGLEHRDSDHPGSLGSVDEHPRRELLHHSLAVHIPGNHGYR